MLDYILKDLDPAVEDMITDLITYGQYSSGTYTGSYTPAQGEIVFIHSTHFTSFAGAGTFMLDYDGYVISLIAVDSSYDEMNANQYIMRKIIGDGTKKLNLTLTINADATYFGSVNMWKVIR